MCRNGAEIERNNFLITSRSVYAGSGDVQFEIDDGAPQFGLNFSVEDSKRIEISLQKGQTRRLVLRLRRLKK